MIRAGVFIGVDRTGDLPRLRDAALGATRMHAWAVAQGMEDGVTAKLITDADGGRVTPDAIFDAIKQVIDGPGVDQLLVYYAGHGVNINRSEHWLLTDAPVRTNAAVSVAGSVELARYCGIQHVVFISDACRVAPEGIQAQNVRGQDVFPNEGLAARSKAVDQFFACLLGRTAAEIKDATVAAGGYRALYTRAVLDGVRGEIPDLLDASEVAGETARYVKVRRLQRYLEVEIPRRVAELGLQHTVNQDPDAIITSDGLWLSRVDAAPPPATRGGRVIDVDGQAPPTRRGAVAALTRAAVSGDLTAVDDTAARLRTEAAPVGRGVADTVATVAEPFGPEGFETECGIKVRGARVTDVSAGHARGDILGSGEVVRVTPAADGTASVVVTVDGPGVAGCGTVVPAIPGFVAGLTFGDGELLDVAYEPSANSQRWDQYRSRAAELRALRGVAAWSSRTGRFQLEGDDAATVARRMQLGKGVDPTLAVYAAYAYHDLQHLDRIEAMSGWLSDDIDVRLFDLELLARRLIATTVDYPDRIVPFTPLLSQGWSLLHTHRVRLHPAIAGLDRTLRDSLWSLYAPPGVRQLNNALATGDVR